MACTNAANDTLNMRFVANEREASTDDVAAESVTLKYGAYMN